MDGIENCVSFLLGKAFQKVSRLSRDALAGHGVTPVQYATLSVLWEEDGRSCAELSARLVLDSATMTGIVDRLETAGHIQRRPDPEGDRRINRVYLTEQARGLRGPLESAMRDLNAQVSRTLGARDVLVRDALRELADVAGSGARQAGE